MLAGSLDVVGSLLAFVYRAALLCAPLQAAEAIRSAQIAEVVSPDANYKGGVGGGNNQYHHHHGNGGQRRRSASRDRGGGGGGGGRRDSIGLDSAVVYERGDDVSIEWSGDGVSTQAPTRVMMMMMMATAG